ncbi:hypothetical protein C8R46DRAFT_1052079 [Mycena filopes]|nr:hypothetical protein C8R46DRAFT_1052079 [Mycena filopes]
MCSTSHEMWGAPPGCCGALQNGRKWPGRGAGKWARNSASAARNDGDPIRGGGNIAQGLSAVQDGEKRRGRESGWEAAWAGRQARARAMSGLGSQRLEAHSFQRLIRGEGSAVWVARHCGTAGSGGTAAVVQRAHSRHIPPDKISSNGFAIRSPDWQHLLVGLGSKMIYSGESVEIAIERESDNIPRGIQVGMGRGRVQRKGTTTARVAGRSKKY